MNRIPGMVLVALGLVVLQPAASAQSECKRAKGNMVEVFDPTSNSATEALSNGGWLDGTAVAVFNSRAYATPVPKQVTFTSTFSLMTNHGQLNGSATYLLDMATGQGTAMVKIDPTTGTGIFAEATGVLFINFLKSDTVSTGPYHEVVGGQICFAPGHEFPEQ